MMKRPLFIDCDPGHDDMMAIMLAVAHPEVDLLGITTVAGNQTGDRTFENARRILAFIGAEDVPVARGADVPLCRDLVTAPKFHGKSGLDGAELPEATVDPWNGTAVDLMARRILGHDGPVTLVPTGPLTNVALALRTYPELHDSIERIVLMGGGVHDSNTTPAAEFNIYVDPEAAAAVFSSGIPITMVGLDATNRAVLDFDQINRLEHSAGPVSRVVGALMRFFAGANVELFNIQGAPIHDALAVAVAVTPDIVTGGEFHVAVETQGDLTRGATVVDLYGVTGNEPNARVALGVDRPRFVAMMEDALAELDRRYRLR